MAATHASLFSLGRDGGRASALARTQTHASLLLTPLSPFLSPRLENVLITSDGYIKICDFGFAKKAASTRTFTKCGTDEYAPPEVVSGRGRTCAADWWALGILLHEMLTGRPPFEGSSAEEVFRSISEFSNGGAMAAEQLQAALLRTAEQISDECAAFLMGEPRRTPLPRPPRPKANGPLGLCS